ncbi:hypothetical protein E3N88_14074 [Mikania micrantha]|uniref:Neprosin PEP catalytic domain-containing protein n=1 Tax=Mikania micrantha TaxID=192012 RepID=A0A5N6P0G1_9ASTR|nr:hypothetical protein E3N88_14074 [Mikania micrantha]
METPIPGSSSTGPVMDIKTQDATIFDALGLYKRIMRLHLEAAYLLLHKLMDRTQGNWWMQLGETVIGYWPASLFSYLSQSSSLIEWGGEVINVASGGQHTTTQMGSGHFPQEGAGKASYIKDIQIVDEFNTLKTPQGLNPVARKKSCYDILMDMNDDFGSHFFYGGPGRNENCP